MPSIPTIKTIFVVGAAAFVIQRVLGWNISLLEIYDLPSLLSLVLGSGFLTLGWFGRERVEGALRRAFEGRADPHTVHQYVAVLSGLHHAVWAMGLTLTAIGLAQFSIGHAAGARNETAGPALAVALIPLLYAMICAEIVIGPLLERLRRGANDP